MITFDMIIKLVNKKIRRERLPKKYKEDVSLYFNEKLKFLKREKQIRKIPSWHWFQDLIDAWYLSKNYLDVNLEGYEEKMERVKKFFEKVESEFKKLREVI